MIGAQYFTVSSSEISAVLDYLFRFALVYIGCFIGTILRDVITASKMNTKVDILNALLYSSPCAFIMATLYDLISDKAGFGVLVLACVFIGMWSREVTSLLLNNKVALGVVKFVVKTLLKGASNISDEDQEKLNSVLEDAVGNGKKTASDQNADEKSAITKEDSQDCITANSDPPESTEPVDSENQDDNNIDEEEELGGDPEGEYSWTKIIGY